MRIITWNCNGAFRKKLQALEQFKADILVIQECEDPKQSADKNYKAWASNFIWTGENKRKGLGIFCTNKIVLHNNNWPANYTRHFISATVNNDFQLIAVWNHIADTPGFHYIGQLWKYLQLNKNLMTKAIITGDFNSNKIWDKPKRSWNHSDVVRELGEINIRSLYHEYFKEAQGEEKTPTFYLQKNNKKPFHIDYVFADKSSFPKIRKFEIGSKRKWLPLSDHLPVIAEL